MEDQYVRVPLSSLIAKVDTIAENTTMLVERESRSSEKLQDHESRLRTIEKLVYRLSIPMASAGAIGVGIEWLAKWISS